MLSFSSALATTLPHGLTTWNCGPRMQQLGRQHELYASIGKGADDYDDNNDDENGKNGNGVDAC